MPNKINKLKTILTLSCILTIFACTDDKTLSENELGDTQEQNNYPPIHDEFSNPPINDTSSQPDTDPILDTNTSSSTEPDTQDTSSATLPDTATNNEVEIDFELNSTAPNFRDVTVHDPMVTKDGNRYWVFGSHLASAYSDDLIRWTQYSRRVENTNPLIPDVYDVLSEAFEWAETTTLWAGSVVKLQNSNFHFYYSACEGSSPKSALGLTVSSTIDGPYSHRQIFLQSGMWGETSEDGTTYNASVHPNTIDPHVFYDADGKLWMVYGSYSGGIFILEMNESTGLPVNSGYGKKLLGGNHSRIEAPYILYSPNSQYYYLFLSFGGLSADGGYNIRVARATAPDGPYLDPEGKDMINCRGPNGSFFDDLAIEPYGGKLIGNFRFTTSNVGYVSPGHNSALYDSDKNKYYIFFHTRFPGTGEVHNVRVHQMYINAQGWPVIAPHRYAGETIATYSNGEIAGQYQLVNHGKDISDEIKNSVNINLSVQGNILGALTGSWSRTGTNTANITLEGTTYYGVFSHNWDNGLNRYVITFSAISNEGISIFGSQIIN